MRLDWKAALRRLGRAYRRPVVGAMTAIAALWLILFAAYPTEWKTNHPADGVYHPIRARGDGHYYYLYTLSLALDRDLDVVDEYSTLGDPFDGLHEATPTGKPYLRPIGSAILQLPAFAVAHATAWVANLFGAGIAMHGYTPWHMAVTFLGNLAAGFLALVFSWRVARRHASETAALYGVLVAGAGSGLLFYAVYWVSYNHAFSALFGAWLFDAWDRTRGRFDARRWAGLGALVGLLALTRQQDAILALVPAAEGAAEFVRRAAKRDLRGAAWVVALGLIAGAIALAILFPQLWVLKTTFGSWLAVPQGEELFRWESPFFWEVLFSTKNGMFVWTPLAYPCALGLLGAPRAAWRTAAALAAFFLLGLYTCGAMWDWWGSWSFGARRMLGVTVVLVAGMAFLVDRLRALHARFPRLAPHAALLGLLAPFFVLNVELSTAASRGKQRVTQTFRADDLYLGSLRRTAKAFNQELGNPFAWPANWLWALRHDARPGAWDEVVGNEKLQMDPRRFRFPGARHADAIHVGRGLGGFNGGGWGAPTAVAGRNVSYAHAPEAHILLPLHVAEDVQLLVSAMPPAAGHPVTIAVNDHEIQHVFPPGFSQLTIDVPDGVLSPGTNDVWIRCQPAPGQFACLGVEKLTLVYEAPRPAQKPQSKESVP